MQRSFGLQISDLETIQSVFEQELTLEEAKKVVGGSGDKDSKEPQEPQEPKKPKNPIDDPPCWGDSITDSSIIGNIGVINIIEN